MRVLSDLAEERAQLWNIVLVACAGAENQLHLEDAVRAAR